jgi:hypothetical protein
LCCPQQSLRANTVPGIFGWPLSDADRATAIYKIDKNPNPNIQDLSYPLIYDYRPVCHDPEHPAPQDGSYDARAAGIGATGGLRMSAFIDEFGKNSRHLDWHELLDLHRRYPGREPHVGAV